MVRASWSLRIAVMRACLAALWACLASADNVCAASGCANADWVKHAQMLEYTSNANPPMREVPVRVFPPSLHQQGPSRVEQLDSKDELALSYSATSPNLLASFIRVLVDEELETGVDWATSQAFYVIRGRGSSQTRAGLIEWQEGDLFVLPYLGDNLTSVCATNRQCMKHRCEEDPHFGGCALYWVHDEPLLRYLGVRPVDIRRFEPTLYPGDVMRQTVGNISTVDENGVVRNRRGILLANPASPQTKTLTPTLWSLLNSISGNATQAPHRHNSVAIDLAVSARSDGKVYTLLGRELDADGHIVNPMKAVWQSGSAFVTPPGWWHSHHNEGSATAWVLPMQDAGLYTHQRTLDIRFMAEEQDRLQKGVNRGATVEDHSAGLALSTQPLVTGTLAFGHLS